jgi:F-type H+-transporting ATPase subunit epsilon
MTQDKLLEVEIVTPQKTVFSGKAQSVTLPRSLAPFQVLFNHAPIVSSLELGQIKIVAEKGNELFYATSNGFTEVSKNVVSVLVETADTSTDIDIEAVKSELNELKTKLSEANKDEKYKLQQMLKLCENKLKIANK